MVKPPDLPSCALIIAEAWQHHDNNVHDIGFGPVANGPGLNALHLGSDE
jgi:hypothetical protein